MKSWIVTASVTVSYMEEDFESKEQFEAFEPSKVELWDTAREFIVDSDDMETEYQGIEEFEDPNTQKGDHPTS